MLPAASALMHVVTGVRRTWHAIGTLGTGISRGGTTPGRCVTFRRPGQPAGAMHASPARPLAEPILTLFPILVSRSLSHDPRR
jgi:hypothetical protein